MQFENPAINEFEKGVANQLHQQQQDKNNDLHCINPKKIQRYARPSQASHISTFLNDNESQSSIPNFDSATKKSAHKKNKNLIQLQEVKQKKSEKLIVFNRQNCQIQNYYEKLTEKSKLQLEKINKMYVEKTNQSQSNEDFETRINEKIKESIENLRLFYNQPYNSASIHHLKQNFYNNNNLDSIFRLNSFDCHKYDQICFINNSNKIAQITFKPPKKQINDNISGSYSMKDNYLSLTSDFYSSISCFNDNLNNVFAYGTFTGPIMSLVDIEQQKILKSYDNPKSSNFEIASTFCQNNFQIFTGLADGNVNVYDYRMKNKIGQIFLENMEQKVKFSPINNISFSKQNNQLLITKPHEAILWDLRNQKLLFSEIGKHSISTDSNNFLKKAYFSNNCAHAILMKSQTNNVSVWDLSLNKKIEDIVFDENEFVKDIQYFDSLQEHIVLVSRPLDQQSSAESPTLKNISPTLKQKIQYFANINQQQTENNTQSQQQQTSTDTLSKLEILRYNSQQQKYVQQDTIELFNYQSEDSAWNDIRNIQKIKLCQNGQNLYLYSNDNVYLVDYFDRDHLGMIKSQLGQHLIGAERNASDMEDDE